MASAIELSLRRALEKGDAADPYFRTSVYEAAERAMDRLAAEKALGPAESRSQREQLIAAIEAIEVDYPELEFSDETDASPAEPSAPRAEPVVRPAIPAGDPPPAAAPPPKPAVERMRGLFSRDAEPPAGKGVDRDWSPGPGGAPDKQRQARRARSLKMAGIGVAVLVLLFLLASFLLPSNDGLPGTDATTTGSLLRRDGAAPVLAADAGAGWIDVFSGDNLEAITTPPGGQVSSIVQAGGARAVRVEGALGGGSELLVGIEPGVMANIAGRRVRGELAVGSPDGQPRRFAIRCLFGGETACGRQEFSTELEEQAFLFDMDVPAGFSGRPGIAIDPDADGGGSEPLNLYRVRLQVL